MIRMLIVGYVFAIRSERQLCREVQVNLAYRWFCDLDLEDPIPDHSAFCRARNERFRQSDLFRSASWPLVLKLHAVPLLTALHHSGLNTRAGDTAGFSSSAPVTR
jgi:hypothetical protein